MSAMYTLEATKWNGPLFMRHPVDIRDRTLVSPTVDCTGWTKLNGANAVSFVVIKHVLENSW